eukprot:COSAG02_NODE_357_length_23913_cov_6.793483_4_plen_110_part_00
MTICFVTLYCALVIASILELPVNCAAQSCSSQAVVTVAPRSCRALIRTTRTALEGALCATVEIVAWMRLRVRRAAKGSSLPRSQILYAPLCLLNFLGSSRTLGVVSRLA